MNAKYLNARYLLAATALLFANLAVAQSVIPAHLPKIDRMHTTPVSNPVQSITKTEAQRAGLAVVVDNFDKIDTNRDGVVTRAELRSYLLANRRHVPMT